MTLHELSDVEHAYSPDEERPLAGYARALATYAGLVGAMAVTVRARGVELPERVSWSDMALLSVATHKLARTIAKDAVTSPIRAPFTRFVGAGAPSEVTEEVRAHGAGHAVGELLTCPFCLGQWVATGFVFGLVVAPRATRLAATVFTTLTAADVLQFGYAALQQSVE